VDDAPSLRVNGYLEEGSMWVDVHGESVWHSIIVEYGLTVMFFQTVADEADLSPKDLPLGAEMGFTVETKSTAEGTDDGNGQEGEKQVVMEGRW
jgi:hypothetical protein